MWVSYWNKPGVSKYIHWKWQAVLDTMQAMNLSSKD